MGGISNLPPWPTDPERQATKVRALLTGKPQTASDLAAFFQEGERILSELLCCLQTNAALGFAAVDKQGWVATQPIPKPIYGSQRQLKNWSIKALLDLHAKHNKADADMSNDDWSALLGLCFELQYRNTPTARDLRTAIRDRLILHRRFPGEDRTDDELRLT